jgi:hypothetical protein
MLAGVSVAKIGHPRDHHEEVPAIDPRRRPSTVRLQRTILGVNGPPPPYKVDALLPENSAPNPITLLPLLLENLTHRGVLLAILVTPPEENLLEYFYQVVDQR